jgi:hypothetical protein
MTPEERNLITELFDRLATLEDAARDPEAERAIKDGLRQAPNAVYALVQTALVQDEALKRADARLQQLEAQLGGGPEPARQQGGSFLGNMRDALFGRPAEPRMGMGSVPPVRPGEAPMGAPGGYRPAGLPPGPGAIGPGGMGPGGMGPGGMGPGPGMEPPRPGGSFLGTAAAAAAGMIGGSLMLDSIRSMMGHQQRPSALSGGDAPGSAQAASSNPWSNSSGGDLGRQAGLDDIGRSPSGSSESGAGRSQGLFDSSNDDTANDQDVDTGNDDGDFDGGFDSDSGDNE